MNKKAGISILLTLILILSIFLMIYEESDGVTTLTGKTGSWDTSPYHHIGLLLFIISGICLVAIAFKSYIDRKISK